MRNACLFLPIGCKHLKGYRRTYQQQLEYFGFMKTIKRKKSNKIIQHVFYVLYVYFMSPVYTRIFWYSQDVPLCSFCLSPARVHQNNIIPWTRYVIYRAQAQCNRIVHTFELLYSRARRGKQNIYRLVDRTKNKNAQFGSNSTLFPPLSRCALCCGAH